MKGMTLKVGRIRAGLTQSELAELVGLTQSIISQLENEFYLPGPDLMELIKRVLKQHNNGK